MPTTDAQGRLVCSDASISLTSTVGRPSYGLGSKPILGLTVVNTGPEACMRDVSGSLQTFTVYGAGNKRMWSTADCFPGEGTDVRRLEPGQSVHYDIRWSGTTSQPGCAGERQPVPAGAYTVVAALGSLNATPATLTITG